jgi:hypothetical protein
MQPSPTVEAVRHFLNVVGNGDAPTDGALSEALDRLVAVYHETLDAPVSDTELEAPRQDGAALYREVENRFPDYGFYPVADPLEPVDQEIGMADAIDDLADLTRDMCEVVWLADNVGPDDAHWSFRVQYLHWGEHARRLSFYLFARQW